MAVALVGLGLGGGHGERATGTWRPRTRKQRASDYCRGASSRM